MDPETLRRIEELQGAIKSASERLTPGIPQDDWNTHKAEVSRLAHEIEGLISAERERAQTKEATELKAQVEALTKRATKADALTIGDEELAIKAGGPADPEDGIWLKSLWEAKTQGDPAAWAALKATLGETSANGGYVIPNNFVYKVIQIAKAKNIYRNLLTVIPGVRGNAVDIPYELDDSSLIKVGAQGGSVTTFGSNKENRNFTLASATATLYVLARIIDVGNQFLKRSEGAAEMLVRSKLGRAFGLAEADLILNGTGVSNQPKGLITSIAAASSTYSTAYSSGVRADTIATAIGVLEGRAYFPTAIVTNVADFWQIVTDTQGTSGSGGYAVSPMGGATFDPGKPGSSLHIWGVPVLRDPLMTNGTAIMGEWDAAQLFTGDEYRVDVSDEAGTRWDTNLTGFRAEEEIAFNADPYVLTGMFQRVTGL